MSAGSVSEEIKVRRSNLEEACDQPPTTALEALEVTAPAAPPRLCLHREMLMNKLSFYYAFGNTPPAYVLPGVALAD
ncbi:hypothetical protein CYMTET_26168 [Cymbomonas tetramitiformis]|uniref:Uncharacterized protein n=1 Tax=Cymbomonas tetramitiformis TaxID=36881 RepID=A0AAE0KYG3_9CHLO|nr:hypothetical protein CYMTET_26168 [Cymbomonas tetramitiformis]